MPRLTDFLRGYGPFEQALEESAGRNVELAAPTFLHPYLTAGFLSRAPWSDAMTLVVAATQEAFAEHFRFSPQPLDEWLRLCFTEGADPDLWFLAWDGDEVAGLVISYVEPYGAYVAELAVRRPWRRRGLGRLLLLTAFAALRERGCATATLGVDAGNESGALGLYEGLGLHETLIHDFYEKTLRDGA